MHTFTAEEMELNQSTLTWPKKLGPIFEATEQLMEEAKAKGESNLTEKQEKVQIEIEKCHRRVEEFSENSDLSMTQQYCKDITMYVCAGWWLIVEFEVVCVCVCILISFYSYTHDLTCTYACS